jgi:hypothetical protein
MLSAFSKHRAEPFRRATRLQSSGCIVGSTDPVGVTPPEPRAPCASRCTTAAQATRSPPWACGGWPPVSDQRSRPAHLRNEETAGLLRGRSVGAVCVVGRALVAQAQPEAGAQRIRAICRALARGQGGVAARGATSRPREGQRRSPSSSERSRGQAVGAQRTRRSTERSFEGRAASSLTSRRASRASTAMAMAMATATGTQQASISDGARSRPSVRERGCGCTAHARSAERSFERGRRDPSPRDDERARRPLTPPARERQRRIAVSSERSGERAGTLWTCGRRLSATGGMRGAHRVHSADARANAASEKTLGFSSGDVLPVCTARGPVRGSLVGDPSDLDRVSVAQNICQNVLA